jgi:hypothetical protein
MVALKMGGGPKVERGKATIKKPTYPNQFKSHNKRKQIFYLGRNLM